MTRWAGDTVSYLKLHFLADFNMSMNNLWGALASKGGNFMSKFGSNVSKGMTVAVSAVSDTVSSLNEEFFNDGEEHYFEEDRSVRQG